MKLASYFESQHFKTIAVLLIKQTRIIGLVESHEGHFGVDYYLTVFFIYALAIVGFFILPREDISRSSYFDENALMSGLATRQFAMLLRLTELQRLCVTSAKGKEGTASGKYQVYIFL